MSLCELVISGQYMIPYKRRTERFAANAKDHPVAASDLILCETAPPQLGVHRFVRICVSGFCPKANL